MFFCFECLDQARNWSTHTPKYKREFMCMRRGLGVNTTHFQQDAYFFCSLSCSSKSCKKLFFSTMTDSVYIFSHDITITTSRITAMEIATPESKSYKKAKYQPTRTCTMDPMVRSTREKKNEMMKETGKSHNQWIPKHLNTWGETILKQIEPWDA